MNDAIFFLLNFASDQFVATFFRHSCCSSRVDVFPQNTFHTDHARKLIALLVGIIWQLDTVQSLLCGSLWTTWYHTLVLDCLWSLFQLQINSFWLRDFRKHFWKVFVNLSLSPLVSPSWYAHYNSFCFMMFYQHLLHLFCKCVVGHVTA